jgi:arginine decarboxylase
MYGLEVGTKSELLLALNGLLDDKQRLLVCSGVKDEEYLKIIRQAILDGHRIWVSAESPNEVKMSLERLPRDKVEFALRVKPYVTVEGHWSQAAGRHAKLGLAIHDLVDVLSLLKSNDAESSVVAIHAHPGSQLSGNVSAFAEFVARIYVHLRDTGLSKLAAVDVGGGLPINYDGHLASDTTQSYAQTVIKAFTDIVGNRYPHPVIMSEAGRFVTALHALLVIRILDVRRIFPMPLPGEAETSDLFKQVGIKFEREENPTAILQAWQDWLKLPPAHKDVNDLLRYERLSGVVKTQLRRKFVYSGDYEDHLINPLAQDLMRPAYILVGDFAVFNGAIDHVLVDQYFPILPIDHLGEPPATLVRLADITSDSDGEISVYSPPISARRLFTRDGFPLTTSRRQQWSGFPIGNLDTATASYVVIALVGAYQDAIRMDASLVGALPDVELHVSDQGRWAIR